MNYRISEIFHSIQGEGIHVGYPAVFVRFAGCNMSCKFCDEEHKYGKAEEISTSDIVHRIEKVYRKGDMVILTGGEPLLQIYGELLEALLGYSLFIETNGDVDTRRRMNVSLEYLGTVAQITVSPKRRNVSPEILSRAECVKVLVDHEGAFGIDLDDLPFTNAYRVLQPITPSCDGYMFEEVYKVHCHMAYRLSIKRQEKGECWRVIPQTHVMMGLK